MNKIVESNLQIKLIALGLLFLIPITINLGINFIYPNIGCIDCPWYEPRQKFLKENIKHYDPENDTYTDNEKKFKQYQNMWESSEQYQELKKQKEQEQLFKFYVFTGIIFLLIILLNFVTIPIIKSSLIGSTLYLFLFHLTKWNTTFKAPIKDEFLLSIPLPIIGIMMSLLCLLIMIYYAHKDQKI